MLVEGPCGLTDDSWRSQYRTARGASGAAGGGVVWVACLRSIHPRQGRPGLSA